MNKKKYITFFALIIIIDQISKFIVKYYFKGENIYREIPVIKGFFNIRFTQNDGAVWGIFSNSPHAFIPIIITSLSIIALIIVIYYFLKIDTKCVLELTSLSFIIGGAVGNIIDRILQGYVVDFLDVFIKNYHWPTFNVADSFITVGVIMIIISIWRGKCIQF